ncbi:hypothetical protein CEXT_270351 [Caerostris extrusa]|uniref:Uncharacterized protein n=1 Tax=Caerostris extrusa TaxID=172846 RepID=A0AAV4SB79_CAEEX|nr:hypothetical protein CEXT_270351 [Caerostris extrusa]
MSDLLFLQEQRLSSPPTLRWQSLFVLMSLAVCWTSQRVPQMNERVVAGLIPFAVTTSRRARKEDFSIMKSTLLLFLRATLSSPPPSPVTSLFLLMSLAVCWTSPRVQR